MERGRDDRGLRLVPIVVGALLLARVPMLPHRSFDPDELEHAHAAWSAFRGLLPYRDFFEHHTPWYYYVLRPFFKWFHVDTSFESARDFLLFGRGLSLALTAISVFLVFRVGRAWADRRAGLLAALLLAAQPLFLQKTIEMRPDVLALPFFLGCLWCLLRGIAQSADAPRARLGWFVAAGLGIGAAVMCTQKMLFALPGMVAGLGVWSLATNRRSRVLAIVVFLLAVGVPGALTWAAFVAQGAGHVFIANNFLLNARWKHTPTGQLLKLIETSAPVLALASWGLAMAARRFVLSRPRDYGDALLGCTLVGLFAGLAVIPVAQRQYYLMPLPIACLFAAQALLMVVDRARERVRASFLVVSILVLSVLPVLALRESFRSRNDLQLARLRQVLERTGPTDLVMDGWEGTGVFRPHAFYYFFIHDELLPMLSRARVDAYLDDLQGGRVHPKLIAFDEHLAALGPRFLSFVEKNYVSHDGFLYFSRD